MYPESQCINHPLHACIQGVAINSQRWEFYHKPRWPAPSQCIPNIPLHFRILTCNVQLISPGYVLCSCYWYNSTCPTLPPPQSFKVTLCTQCVFKAISKKKLIQLKRSELWVKTDMKGNLLLQKGCLTSTLPWPSCLTCLQEKTTGAKRKTGSRKPTPWTAKNMSNNSTVC